MDQWLTESDFTDSLPPLKPLFSDSIRFTVFSLTLFNVRFHRFFRSCFPVSSSSSSSNCLIHCYLLLRKSHPYVWFIVWFSTFSICVKWINCCNHSSNDYVKFLLGWRCMYLVGSVEKEEKFPSILRICVKSPEKGGYFIYYNCIK